MVPDAVTQYSLHSLLGRRNPHGLPGTTEQDISQPDPSEVPPTPFRFLSSSGSNKTATEALLSQRAVYIPAGSSDSEPPLQLVAQNIAASAASEERWYSESEHSGSSSDFWQNFF